MFIILSAENKIEQKQNARCEKYQYQYMNGDERINGVMFMQKFTNN